MRPKGEFSRAWTTAFAFVTCASVLGPAETKKGTCDLAWPPGDPRVCLERVIQYKDGGRSGMRKLLRWFGGSKRSPLFERPYGVAWDGNDLIVTDTGARQVVRITERGRAKASTPGVVENPIGVAACSQGIVVTDSATGKVALLSPDLKRTRFIAHDLSRPTGVACVGNRIFVVETGEHRILVQDPDGSWSNVGQRGGNGGEFNFPTSVAVGDDSLWIGDTLNFRVQRFDVEMTFQDAFGKLGDAPGDMPRIKGIDVDSAGHIWVSDAYLDQVSLYTPDGMLLMSLGGGGLEPGRFSFPAGIAAHRDGRVAVVDSLNRRVQIFRLLESGKGR